MVYFDHLQLLGGCKLLLDERFALSGMSMFDFSNLSHEPVFALLSLPLSLLVDLVRQILNLLCMVCLHPFRVVFLIPDLVLELVDLHLEAPLFGILLQDSDLFLRFRLFHAYLRMQELLLESLVLALQVFLTLLQLFDLVLQLFYLVGECSLRQLPLIENLIHRFTCLQSDVLCRCRPRLLLHGSDCIVKHSLHFPMLTLFIIKLLPQVVNHVIANGLFRTSEAIT